LNETATIPLLYRWYTGRQVSSAAVDPVVEFQGRGAGRVLVHVDSVFVVEKEFGPVVLAADITPLVVDNGDALGVRSAVIVLKQQVVVAV
jgi:hypothetical protein